MVATGPPFLGDGSSDGRHPMNNFAMEEPANGPEQSRPKRILKVGKVFRHRYRAHWVARPLIRLSGKWLEQAGFRISDTFEVRAHNGEIRLTVRHAPH